MTLPEWRRAGDVLPSLEGKYPKPKRCPFCPFPIQPNEAVVKTPAGWVHTYCWEGGANDADSD